MLKIKNKIESGLDSIFRFILAFALICTCASIAHAQGISAGGGSTGDAGSGGFSGSSRSNGALNAVWQNTGHQPRTYATQGYTDEIEDMRVKVHGGYVIISRTYKDKQWHINRRWNPILEVFEQTGTSTSYLCSTPGCSGSSGGINDNVTTDPDEPPKPSALSRNGYRYERVSDKLYQFGKRKTITVTDSGYRWQDSLGNWIEYGPDRKVMRYGGRNEAAYLRLAYDTNSYISGVFDALDNQVLWIETNGSGHITAVRDIENRRVEYSFATGGANNIGGADDPFAVPLISAVKDVRGYSWQYTYDSKGQLNAIIDPEGRTKAIGYSEVGNVKSIVVYGPGETIAEGIGTDYEYDYNDDAGQLYVQERASGGKVTERWYDVNGEIVREDINTNTLYTVTIENGGRKRIRTDYNGFKTVNDYDAKDNITKTTYPDGATESWSYDQYSNILTYTNANGVTTKNEYDDRGNLIKATEASGKPAERITEYQYDQYGNQTEIKQLGDADTAEAITVYEYDAKGNSKKMTDPEGHITEYTHDSQGNVLTEKDPRENVWTYTYDNAGNRLTEKTPLDHVTTYAYDKVGNLIKVTDALTHPTQYKYDAQDNLIERIDADGNSQYYTYNKDNLLTQIVDEEGKLTRFEYDISNRLIKQIDGNNNVIAFEYGQNNGGYNNIGWIHYPTYTVSYHYDKRQRLVETRTLLNADEHYVETFAYDGVGNLISSTDAEDRSTYYQYDALNRLVQVRDPLDKTVQYIYDDRHNLLQVINENNVLLREYAYDRNNRLTQEIWPDTGVFIFEYDGNGNQTQKTDAKQQLSKYTYDDDNRLRKTEYFATVEASAATKTVDYSYNAVGSITGYNDGTSSGSYSYDKLQRKLTEQVNYGPFSLNHQYGYYKNSTKQSLTYPDGSKIDYAYDGNNQVNQVDLPGEGILSISAYNWFMPERIIYPGGSTQQNSYDALLRLTQRTLNDAAANPKLEYAYTYDRVSNITQKITEHGSYSYTYDARDRLLSADNPLLTDEAYTYDGTGNRLTAAITGEGLWQYNETNQLLTDTQSTYSYDANGSLHTKITADQTLVYQYDLEDRLTHVKTSDNQSIAQYTYDPFGRRLSKTVAGQTTYFQYADEGLIGEYNASGELLQAYGYWPDSTWGTNPLFTRVDNEYHYYINDHLGTPQQLITKTGAITWTAQYTAFGEATINEDPDNNGKQTVNNFRFSGQYFDQETNTHYNYFRDYDPSLGRYLTSDPIGLLRDYSNPQFQLAIEMGMLEETDFAGEELNHLYGYVGQNPLYWIDPYGLAGSNQGTGGSSGKGTSNPYKHCKEHPTDPTKIICKQKGTGKKIIKPKPADWPGNDQNNQSKSICDDDCQAGLILVGGVCIIAICVIAPEICLIGAGASMAIQ